MILQQKCTNHFCREKRKEITIHIFFIFDCIKLLWVIYYKLYTFNLHRPWVSIIIVLEEKGLLRLYGLEMCFYINNNRIDFNNFTLVELCN